MNRAPILLAIAALLGVFVLFVRTTQLQDELKKARGGVRPAVQVAASSTVAPTVEVAHYMGRIQNYTHKLWFAGQAGNKELAEFYRHEIKEEMETIANAGIVDNGVPVSDHMKVYGIRAIDALKEQIRADGLKDFPARYEALINTCNSCHAVSGHPELRMQVPVSNRFPEQDFAPHQ